MYAEGTFIAVNPYSWIHNIYTLMALLHYALSLPTVGQKHYTTLALFMVEVYPSHNQMILLQLPILTQYLHADGPGILCFTAPRHHAILYDLKPHPYHYEHHSLVTPIGCHADVKCKMYKTAMSITLCPHSFKRFGSWEQQTS
jgi:hypothetical protein